MVIWRLSIDRVGHCVKRPCAIERSVTRTSPGDATGLDGWSRSQSRIALTRSSADVGDLEPRSFRRNELSPVGGNKEVRLDSKRAGQMQGIHRAQRMRLVAWLVGLEPGPALLAPCRGMRASDMVYSAKALRSLQLGKRGEGRHLARKRGWRRSLRVSGIAVAGAGAGGASRMSGALLLLGRLASGGGVFVQVSHGAASFERAQFRQNSAAARRGEARSGPCLVRTPMQWFILIH